MVAEDTALETIYYKGTMGFAPNPLATVVNFSLLLNYEDNSVSGTVKINVGTDKKSYTGKVSGKVYSTGLNGFLRVLSLQGNIPSDDKLTPLEFPFEANMALKADWSGEGGFSFQGQHEENVPVKGSIFNEKATIVKNNIFQLSALSQNDSGATDGSNLYCKITKINNGFLRAGSSPVNEYVHLPIPPGASTKAPKTPTWFLETEKGKDASFEITISCPDNPEYPVKSITIKESDVIGWAAEHFEKRVNQIYQKGDNGIIGFAQKGPEGYIYTITAGILNPRLHGNLATI
ncbi:hypothetical protein BTO06_13745 [Tenacibaculum sp. SZ-18]|uniref:DUF1842 domain-containing protein n=1 Tax=Tenacibaculum sp. SZ-18 TaxID=754423 RepID=UPI000C2D0471|nr:DUF1842 domain-containing protein [Tenacibaculum sp. SZ-18]AUC16157.1 hypothetical protein BTO06_13745 [Tenacibaculum sp. SZ-18]